MKIKKSILNKIIMEEIERYVQILNEETPHQKDQRTKRQRVVRRKELQAKADAKAARAAEFKKKRAASPAGKAAAAKKAEADARRVARGRVAPPKTPDPERGVEAPRPGFKVPSAAARAEDEECGAGTKVDPTQVPEAPALGPEVSGDPTAEYQPTAADVAELEAMSDIPAGSRVLPSGEVVPPAETTAAQGAKVASIGASPGAAPVADDSDTKKAKKGLNSARTRLRNLRTASKKFVGGGGEAITHKVGKDNVSFPQTTLNTKKKGIYQIPSNHVLRKMYRTEYRKLRAARSKIRASEKRAAARLATPASKGGTDTALTSADNPIVARHLARAKRAERTVDKAVARADKDDLGAKAADIGVKSRGLAADAEEDAKRAAHVTSRDVRSLEARSKKLYDKYMEVSGRLPFSPSTEEQKKANKAYKAYQDMEARARKAQSAQQKAGATPVKGPKVGGKGARKADSTSPR